jgi:hypoxanthine phosphoribosyltransferase
VPYLSQKACSEGQFRLASEAGWRILLVVASSLLPSENSAADLMGYNRLILSTHSEARVPARWRREVERILITDDLIARRIRQMGHEIERDFKGREMVVVSLLNGTVMFLADLIRNLSLPLRLDFIGVSSYGVGTESGDLVFTKELRLDVRGRDVLLVDDILDTGKTLRRVLEKLRALKPRRIKTCVLLNKAARRTEDVEADYVGFEIPDFFVVGYGLDFAERYRNLPFVGVLHPHVYKQGQAGVASNGKRARK